MPRTRQEAIAEAKAVIDAIHSSDDLNQQVAAIRQIIPNAQIFIDENNFIVEVKKAGGGDE